VLEVGPGLGVTMVTVDPATLPARLAAPGFAGVEVAATSRRVRFRAWRPPAA
jgi:hypothetical protein